MNKKPFSLKDCAANGGYFGEFELDSLIEQFPRLMVCAKMGQSFRFRLPANEFKIELDKRLADGDYVREAFISAIDLDKMRELGII
jgi:hypothetical protein